MMLDVKQELAAYPVNPAIRQEIESLWPDVETRLAREAARKGKDASGLSTQVFFGVLVGLFFAASSPLEQRQPLAEALTKLIFQMVEQLPPAHAHSLPQSSPEWGRLLQTFALQGKSAAVLSLDATSRESIYEDDLHLRG